MNDFVEMDQLVRKFCAEKWLGRVELKFEAGNVRSARKVTPGEGVTFGQSPDNTIHNLRAFRAPSFFGEVFIEFAKGSAELTRVAESIRIK